MREDFLPSNPGPVPVTRQVRRATDTPTASHRSVEFETIPERTRDGIDHVLGRSSPSPGAGQTSVVHSAHGYGRWCT